MYRFLIAFDAADVDPSSLILAGAAPRMMDRSARGGSLVDVYEDGDLDVLVHFPISKLDLTLDNTEAVLMGETYDGTPIRGSDTNMPMQAQALGLKDVRQTE